MGLDKQGMRYVFRSGDYRWVHKLEMHAADVDCTDMSDEEFHEFVVAHEVSE